MRILLAALWCAASLSAAPPNLNPVQWSLSAAPLAGQPGKLLLKLHGEIEPGFHFYSLTTPKGGPMPARVRTGGDSATASAVYQPKPETRFEPLFGLPVETFSNHVDFLIPASLINGRQSVSVSVRYQACNGEICLPPVERTAEVNLPASHQAASIPPGYQRVSQ